MTFPPYLHERDGALWIAIKAQPRASKTEIAGLHGDALKVRVAAPPVDSAANEALRDALAGWLDCPRSAVSLAKGGASRQKVFRVEGVAAATAALRLRPPSD